MKSRQQICFTFFLFAILFISIPASLAQGNEKFTVKTKGFTFALEQCKMSGGTVLCTFTIMSNDFDRNVRVDRDGSRIVDNAGNQFRIKQITIANGDYEASLVANVPTKMAVISDDFKSISLEIALLQVAVYSGDWFNVSLRKVPIVSDSDINNSNVNYSENNPFRSIDNVAYKKPVYISTNDADDIPDNGVVCNNPSEITDGFVKKNSDNCAIDGLMGFRNTDFNQLMEITVTINLQQTYNITKIRYNQGDVWSGSTWNADWMITPFGKTKTNAGSENKGAWTEQTGTITASKIQITFQKTKTKWNEDWLTIGEIEVIGTPLKSNLQLRKN